MSLIWVYTVGLFEYISSLWKSTKVWLLLCFCYWNDTISTFAFHRYEFPELDGAFTYVFADDAEKFNFTEVQIQGGAHLAFKAKSGVNRDSASVYAGNVTGDKTGQL